MLALNEWKYSFSQPQIIISLLVFPILALVFSIHLDTNSNDLGEKVQLCQIMALMILLPLAVAILSVPIFLRDVLSDMTAIISCTGVNQTKRWFLRFTTLVGLLFSIFMCSYIVILGSQIPNVSLNLIFFLTISFNIICLIFPTILLFSVLALWLSRISGSAVAVYFMLVSIGCLYLLMASMTGSPLLAGSSVYSERFYQLMLWLDPYGVSAFINDLNGSNLILSTEFLINRLIYTCISVLMLFFVLYNKKLDIKKRIPLRFKSRNSMSRSIKKSPRSFIFESPLLQLVNFKFKIVMSNKLTHVICVCWPMIIFNEVLSGLGQLNAFVVYLPNSVDALNLVAFELFDVMGVFVIALWTWLICTTEKTVRFSELVAASPVPTRQLFYAQCIVLFILVLLLLLLTFIGSTVAEIVAQSDWLFEHYIIQLSLSGYPLVVLGILFICLHHFLRSNLFIGLCIAIIILIKFTSIMTSLGLTHTLWNIASSPLQEPDNFWGYAASGSVFLPYMTIWTLTCISLSLLAINQSHRGTGLGSFNYKKISFAITFSFIITGVSFLVMHFALINEKPLYNSIKKDRWKTHYEQTFAEWRYKKQPTIVDIKSQVDFYPNKLKAHFKVTYTIENQSNQPIKQLLIGRHPNYGESEIHIKNAHLEKHYRDLNQRIYTFNKALKPKEQSIVTVQFTYQQPTLWPNRSRQAINSKFAYLEGNTLLPSIGYQSRFELLDNQLRKRYGLNTFEQAISHKRYLAKSLANQPNSFINSTTVISTLKSHNALSQGKLIKKWSEGARAFYQFETKQPIDNNLAWLSFDFNSISKQVEGIELVAYTPFAKKEVEVSLGAMEDTARWLSQHVGPYTGEQMSLVATPNKLSQSFSTSQILLVNELSGFRAFAADNTRFDQRYRITAHEVAKQWFVHNASELLTDTLARYIELIMIEKKYGQYAANTLANLEKARLKRALNNKSVHLEPLAYSTKGPITHSQALIVFAQLRALIGDKAITLSLKKIRKTSLSQKMTLTLMDFLNTLKSEAPSRYHEKIENLFLSTP